MKWYKHKNLYKDITSIKIAFYDCGNIEDPLYVLHDNTMRPIVDSNERVILKKDGIRAKIMIKKGCVSGPLSYLVFNDRGKGTLYKTNKRIIYIREPIPLPGGYLFLAPAYMGWAMEWKKKGRKECFSIPLESISGYKKRRQATDVYLWSDEMSRAGWKQCILTIMGDLELKELLGDILKDNPLFR